MKNRCSCQAAGLLDDTVNIERPPPPLHVFNTPEDIEIHESKYMAISGHNYKLPVFHSFVLTNV